MQPKSIQCSSRIVIALIVFSVALPAYAATFNFSMAKSHGAWSSFYMYLGDERHGRAAVTKGEETFAINLPVGRCNAYQAVLYGDTDFSAETSGSLKLDHVRARIDKMRIHDLNATLTTQKGEMTLYVYFTLDEPRRFWNELRKGHTVRFEVKIETGEPSYSSFSLDGSAAALSRARSICKQKSPESYFDDSPGSDGETTPKSDSEYF